MSLCRRLYEISYNGLLERISAIPYPYGVWLAGWKSALEAVAGSGKVADEELRQFWPPIDEQVDTKPPPPPERDPDGYTDKECKLYGRTLRNLAEELDEAAHEMSIVELLEIADRVRKIQRERFKRE